MPEIGYLCDKCEHGMMQSCSEADPATGMAPHQCVICGYRRSFKWVSYPRIAYMGQDEV